MKLFSHNFSDESINRRKKSIKQNKINNNNIVNEKPGDLDHIKTLEELYTYIKNFNCPLKHTAQSTVIFSGPENSPVMIIGEAPGFEEDQQGKPFVGRSGKLIDYELAKLNIDRNKIYVSNIVNWRPPENRTPTDEEIKLFKPIIQKHIELINPKYLILLGSTSMNALYHQELPISKVRGNLIDYNKNTKMIITFHPSYILRSDKNRVFLQHDFKMIANELSANNLMNLVQL
jgi:uracil-DNA glycosylase family 4